MMQKSALYNTYTPKNNKMMGDHNNSFTQKKRGKKLIEPLKQRMSHFE